MPNLTANYSIPKPIVNDPADEDLWGTYLNDGLDLIDAQMKTNADAIAAFSMEDAYPVGSLYFNAAVSTNPATLLGFGTWEAFGAGRVILGVGTGNDGTDGLVVAAGATGGAYNHVLTIDEMPAHDHAGGTYGNTESYLAGGNPARGGNNQTYSGSVPSNGGGLKHNNTQPWIGVYIWKRTA